MATAQSNGKDLLDAVRQMTPEEFDAFLDKALSQRAQPRPATLSRQESKLLERINRGLSEQFHKRYGQLSQKRKQKTLTAEEHQELLNLTAQAESRDADRAAALVELAKLWHKPVRVLMKQLEIQAAPVHG